MSDPLPSGLAAALRASAARRGGLGDPITYFTEIGSTNDAACRLAEQGASSGTTVVASTQTAGRGRLGRRWHSPADAGLYVSVVIRGAAAGAYLTLAGGVAVAEGIIRAAGLPVQIKWPNDVIVPGVAGHSRYRKVAGVLAEASSGAAGISHAVLGFGINLRTARYPAEISDRATSIERELGRPVDAWAVLVETLAALRAQLERLDAGVTGDLLEAWRRLAPSSQGSIVTIGTSAGRVEGVTTGIDDAGALLVRVGGHVERVIAGEVAWQ